LGVVALQLGDHALFLDELLLELADFLVELLVGVFVGQGLLLVGLLAGLGLLLGDGPDWVRGADIGDVEDDDWRG
jgi:hypothetical protein